ncbi:LysR family transcriptional regulator [Leucobacter insecticola]|uniref:LysR family transcriptional regulator n=1 Tax=Leucobacter insecticola TaxID=2714934 RepID=A0A6G8FGQ4_9MICO|nr:LysR family transcriptional regulator [Leucobacter insecticola]QIM15449.1 LysR family transcriptional regulator [Leucobacter insecticola]
MSVRFTLVQLRYFVTVARLEHMTAAAAELNVTQSTLSSAIAQLEAELGVPLFVRLPRRGLRLTPAGHTLLARSDALLEEAELISRSVHEADPVLTGDLVVGIYAPLAPFRAPALLQQFERLHPGVNLVFLEGDQGTLQQALLDGRCEVALMYDLGVGEQFARRVIETIPPHIIVSERHPIAVSGRHEVSLSEFADEPLILLNLPHTREYYLGLFKLLGITPRLRHVSLGYETVRSFVALGHGYSVLNHWVDHGMTYAGEHVVPIRLSESLPPTEASLVRLKNLRPTQKSLAFESVCLGMVGDTAAASSS